MCETLYAFDSGMSESFVHRRLLGGITGLITGGPVAGLAGFAAANGGGTPTPSVGGTDRCGNPSFRPGEPTSVAEARFRCANPLRATITPSAILPFGDPFITVDRGNGAAPPAAQFAQVPTRTAVAVDKCPKFADGATGILWMNALTGQVVCLPRRSNGLAFGLIRKNKPRRKPFISAAQKKQLDTTASLQKKAKEFATSAGFKCSTTKTSVKGKPKKKAC